MKVMDYKRLMLAVSLLWMMGCNEIEFQNGEIPPEYQNEVARLVGDYPGAFQFQPGTLRLEMLGNKPVLSFFDDRGGNDLLGGSCGSEIGSILSASVRKSAHGEMMINRVRFAFDPRGCASQVHGRDLLLTLDQTSDGAVSVSAQVLERVELRWEFDGNDCFYTPRGVACSPRYKRTQIPIYLTGRFFRMIQ